MGAGVSDSAGGSLGRNTPPASSSVTMTTAVGEGGATEEVEEEVEEVVEEREPRGWRSCLRPPLPDPPRFLSAGERPPQIRRRVGTTFKLDDLFPYNEVCHKEDHVMREVCHIDPFPIK